MYIAPVSYTHLDVYKRQGLVEHMRYNLRAASAKLFLALPQVLGTETDKAFAVLEAEVWKLVDAARGDNKAAPIPVSYTHLDVYKRQALSMSARYGARCRRYAGTSSR